MTDTEEDGPLRPVTLQEARAPLAARLRVEEDLRRANERAAELEAALDRTTRAAQLGSDVARALTGIEPLSDLLFACATSIVRHLDAALARIWTLSEDGATLELQASAGLSEDLGGRHARVNVATSRIGTITRERRPYLTHDLQHEPGAADPEWAAREGLSSFAAYPLFVQARPIGVIALFAKEPLRGDVLGAVASVADIMALGIERRREATARVDVELRKASILEASVDAIIVFDHAGRIIDWSQAAEKQFLYPRASVLGKEMAELILPPDLRDRHRRALAEYLRTGQGLDLGTRMEMLARRADGTELPIEISITPMSVGGSLELTCYLRDITDRRKAEAEHAAHLASEQQAHAAQQLAADRSTFLAEATPALASVLDVRKTLSTLARLAVPKLADWCSVDMVRSDGTIEQVAVAHIDPAKAALAETFRSRYPTPPNAPYGVPHVIRTGQPELHVDVSDEQLVAVAVDAEHLEVLRGLRLRSVMTVPLVVRGKPLGAITLVFSDSERHYAVSDLRFVEELARRAAIAVDNAKLFESEQNARASAETANRGKDEFLATVSHELRTPLNAMLGWTRLLRGGKLSPEKRDRALETIERNAVTQTQLIEDLLDVSRIIGGNLRLDVRSVALPQIVQQVLDALELAARARNIQLVTRIDPRIVPIQGDAQRLQQVVWNLLSNAVKFTPTGGRIDLALTCTETSVTLAVTDNGRGIEPEFLLHAFERFKQANATATRVHGGLGLGLAICRHIVELHGGVIEAASEGLGRGSTFTVRLPVSLASSSAQPIGPRRRGDVDGFSQQPDLVDLRVLVVDDEPDARELLAEILTGCGSIVSLAGTVAEAMTRLQVDKPQVLISDIGLPGEDGYTLIRRIRALPTSEGGEIPAAALSAYARAEDRQRALDAGFMMHMSKPMEPTEIIAAVANLRRLGGPR